jgi:hypothetical protein
VCLRPLMPVRGMPCGNAITTILVSLDYILNAREFVRVVFSL